MVLKVNGIQSRNGSFYYRRVVPVQLRPLLNGRTEYVFALHTKDMVTAIARAEVPKAKVSKILADAQRLHDGSVTDGDLTTFRENLKRALVDRETRESIDRVRPLTPREVRINHEELVEHLHTLTAKVQAGGPAKPLRGGKAGEGSPLERAKLLANLDATREILRRMDGDTDGDPQDNPRLTEVFKRWVREKKPSSKLEKNYGTPWDRLVMHVGDCTVKALTKSQIRSWRDALEKMSVTNRDAAGRTITRRNGRTTISHGTVRKNLNAVKSILSWCVEEDLIESNPAHGVSVKAPSDGEVDAPRLPYTEADLEMIFTSQARPEPRMLSTLLLVTGMRLNEAVGLRLEDVKTERGVLYADIRPHAGRRVKSKAATRRVPVHATIAPALLAHVNERKQAGAMMVFPGVKGATFSMRWSRFVDALNIPDRERKPGHSLRHAWQTTAREAGIPDDVRRVLLGHAGGGVAAGYGSWPITVLADHVNRMQWPASVLATAQP